MEELYACCFFWLIDLIDAVENDFLINPPAALQNQKIPPTNKNSNFNGMRLKQSIA